MAWMIKEGIYSVGVQDWDRRLFDELIPLPDGTSYNSFIIKGSEKTALIDTVDPTMKDELLDNISKVEVDGIDYIIANHAEQDHSGCLPLILGKYPGSKVVTNDRCKEYLMDLLQIEDDRFILVKDRETLSLGDRTLEFIITPWVHWPETMVTYLKEDKILFSCDLFGSHLATSDHFVTDKKQAYQSAKRYYAEIMMPFRQMIKGHMQTLAEYDIDMILASHGPFYDDPRFILDAYEKWLSDEVNNKVVIPFVSMHGSTKEMVDHLVGLISDRGITVKPYNLTKTDLGDLASELVDCATIILATPTVLGGPHPAAVYATYIVGALKPKALYASIIGSFGWGGQTKEKIISLLGGSKMEFIDPVIVKGSLNKDSKKALKKLADAIFAKHEENDLVKKR